MTVKVYLGDRVYSESIKFIAPTFEDVQTVTEVLWKYGENISKIEITDEKKEEQDDKA